ncbi:MAG TPA: tripartite tricarboxylate transporter substrate binding protein [Burkholderiaceae bacterium]|jgi:tripartite-type tricarboxylate transporter receptor subunit TctC|nr:tripartite tricarboxylate transporter substrate binding protein [Burkholderiaceae bacterium]
MIDSSRRFSTRRVLALFAGALFAGAHAPAAVAQSDWPARPVRIVVPFAPGGTTDITARIIAEQLTGVLKQTVVVENKAGAGGNVGAAEVARAAPDGYTFLMGTPGTQAINQFLYPRMPYDTAKDLVPVSFTARVPNVLMVHPSVPASSINELIALARSRPGALTYGSPGNGATGHLSTELFKTQARVFITHIPYRGSLPMLQDLMAGQIQMSIDNLPSALPYIKSGKLRALGVSSLSRSEQLPDVPTIASVLPGFSAESWFVLMAPTGTPRAIIERMSAEVDRIVKKKDVADRLKALGAEPVGGTPEQLGKFIADETRKWQQVVKASGAKID